MFALKNFNSSSNSEKLGIFTFFFFCKMSGVALKFKAFSQVVVKSVNSKTGQYRSENLIVQAKINKADQVDHKKVHTKSCYP